MDEHYWRDFRARVRKRASTQMMLLIAPALVVLAILKILEPMDYPSGDIRNSIEFRLVFYGLWIAVMVGAFIAGVRWLRADSRKPR